MPQVQPQLLIEIQNFYATYAGEIKGLPKFVDHKDAFEAILADQNSSFWERSREACEYLVDIMKMRSSRQRAPLLINLISFVFRGIQADLELKLNEEYGGNLTEDDITEFKRRNDVSVVSDENRKTLKENIRIKSLSQIIDGALPFLSSKNPFGNSSIEDMSQFYSCFFRENMVLDDAKKIEHYMTFCQFLEKAFLPQEKRPSWKQFEHPFLNEAAGLLKKDGSADWSGFKQDAEQRTGKLGLWRFFPEPNARKQIGFWYAKLENNIIYVRKPGQEQSIPFVNDPVLSAIVAQLVSQQSNDFLSISAFFTGIQLLLKAQFLQPQIEHVNIRKISENKIVVEHTLSCFSVVNQDPEHSNQDWSFQKLSYYPDCIINTKDSEACFGSPESSLLAIRTIATVTRDIEGQYNMSLSCKILDSTVDKVFNTALEKAAKLTSETASTYNLNFDESAAKLPKRSHADTESMASEKSQQRFADRREQLSKLSAKAGMQEFTENKESRSSSLDQQAAITSMSAGWGSRADDMSRDISNVSHVGLYNASSRASNEPPSPMRQGADGSKTGLTPFMARTILASSRQESKQSDDSFRTRKISFSIAETE